MTTQTLNALGKASSAYLRSAMHQPIYWHEWGEEAFAPARRENKPILLDIGAVWCHWCHVMDRESCDDPEIAQIVNERFVAIKVDRDERPDIDSRYQVAVQAISGQGGWPLTAFLTPDGKPFYGGTYFPPGDNYGRPSFRRVLISISDAYREKNADVVEQAAMVEGAIAHSESFSGRTGDFSPQIIQEIVDSALKMFDETHGGFGSAPKFPHPSMIDLLLDQYQRDVSHRGTGEGTRPHVDTAENLKHVFTATLEKMARGGVYDQLAGGFHRYSVDERWIVPHFEKMSYDNSELLRAYLSAYQAFGIPLFRDVATGIVDWVLEVMADKERGSFATSQDADLTFGDDGDYWTWTVDEAKAALMAREFAVAAHVFDIDDVGEMHDNPKKNVLWWKQDPGGDDEWPVLRAAIKQLKEGRDRRQAPFVDRTAYVNWNAMMAGAFLQAGAVLDRPECNQLALRVLERIWKEAWDAERGMSHVLGRLEPRGMLDDNVQAAAAFLEACEATGEPAWLDRAAAVMTYCGKAHADDTAGYFDIAATNGTAYLATRAKPVQDAPTPSPNCVAGLVLARLAALTDKPEWRSQRDRHLRAFAGSARELSLYGATLLRAIDWAVHPVTRIEVAGPRGDGPACAMHLLALQTYRPRKVVVRKVAERPAATVCVGTSCSVPVSTPEQLATLLEA